MIKVDDRIGSVELIPILKNIGPKLCRSTLPPQVVESRLLCGDVAFEGEGRDGVKVLVGVERKRLSDMINSMRSGRYEGKQLPEMCEYYDPHCSYLIIEGQFRCGITGDLEKLITRADPMADTTGGKWFPVAIGGRGAQVVRYAELDHLICKAQASGVKVRTSATDYETCAQILSLYTHYQKPHDKQSFTGALHVLPEMATVGKAGLVRKWAASLSGIGWERSGDVALKFGTGEELAGAGVEEWETVRGIGKTLAKRAYDQIRGKYKDPKEI